MLQALKEAFSKYLYVDLYIGLEDKRRLPFYIVPNIGDVVWVDLDTTVKITGRGHETLDGGSNFYLVGEYLSDLG